jgi:hypothetical protein
MSSVNCLYFRNFLPKALLSVWDKLDVDAA